MPDRIDGIIRDIQKLETEISNVFNFAKVLEREINFLKDHLGIIKENITISQGEEPILAVELKPEEKNAKLISVSKRRKRIPRRIG